MYLNHSFFKMSLYSRNIAPGHPPGGQHVVGARGLVAMGHGGALAQEQGPVVAEFVVIPGILHRLDLQVLRGVPVISQLSQYWPLIGSPVAQAGRLLPAFNQNNLP